MNKVSFLSEIYFFSVTPQVAQFSRHTLATFFVVFAEY